MAKTSETIEGVLCAIWKILIGDRCCSFTLARAAASPALSQSLPRRHARKREGSSLHSCVYVQSGWIVVLAVLDGFTAFRGS